MKLWEEIVAAAIVGTDRRKFELPETAGGETLSRLLNSLQTDQNEVSLLKTAAVVSTYLKNGVSSTMDQENMPEEAPVESLAFLSRRSEHHLATLLAGNYPAVLSEFFSLAAAHRRVLPPPFLPEVLDAGNSKRHLRPLILPVLGERGRWLAGWNKDWQWALTGENATEIWETGERSERLLALEIMRRQDPAAARELLTRDWSGEAAKDRAAFLEVLKIELGRSDEEFLEAALQTDKSGDVRRAAFNLLLKMPDSKQVKALTGRSAALFNFTPGGFLSKPKIKITFPANFEKDDQNDPLDNLELYLDRKHFGKKGAKLIKLLHAVPPRFWEENFSARKEDIIKATEGSDWQNALLFGLRSGAVNHADREWMLSLWPQTDRNNYYQLKNEIERGWTNKQIEELIVSLLEGGLTDNSMPDFAAQLFYSLKDVWSDDFTSKILDFLRRLAIQKELLYFNGLILAVSYSGQYIAAKYLEQFGEKSLRPLFEKDSELLGNAKSIEGFIAVMEFRREMRAAFENEE